MDRPKRIAIAIGINDYGFGIPPLIRAKNDAESVAGALERYGFETEQLLNQHATKEAIERLLEKDLPARVEDQPFRIVIYFAGHGHVAPDAKETIKGYLLPVDAERRGHKNFLEMDWLLRTLENLERTAVRDAKSTRHILIILDCCFAGAFARTITRDLDGDAGPMNRRHYHSLLQRKAFQFLASTAHDELALDSFASKRAGEAINSPFTRALLSALEDGAADKNRDGVITATEIYLHIAHNLKANNIKQTPNLWTLGWHQGGEFLFELGQQQLNESTPTNPYIGLKPFTEGDRDVFFGRTEFAKSLVERAFSKNFTIILGPLGIGKSSILAAGLLPRLRARIDTHNKDTANKFTRIRICGPFRPSTVTENELHIAFDTQESSTIVLVDQFEELLTRATKGVRGLLENKLIDVLSGADRRVHIVAALRSDYEPHFLSILERNKVARSHWGDARVFVRPMNREELRQAIELPAARRYIFFDPEPRMGLDGEVRRLVDRLLDEVAQMPGALPLLSVALREMFDRFSATEDSDWCIGWDEYNGIGGVVGALQARADAVYNSSSRSEGNIDDPTAFQETLRRVMIRMISIEGGQLTRRRVPRSEFEYGNEEEDQRVVDVLIRLLEAGLIVGPHPADARPLNAGDHDADVYYEPAHDSLIVGWPRMTEWVNNEQDRIASHRDLTRAAEQWQRKKQQDLLWHNEQLFSLVDASIRLHSRHGDAPLGILSARERTRRNFHRLIRVVASQLQVSFVERNVPRFTFNQIELEFIRQSAISRRRSALIPLCVVGAIIFGMGIGATEFIAKTLLTSRAENLHGTSMILASSYQDIATHFRELWSYSTQLLNEKEKSKTLNNDLESAKSQLSSEMIKKNGELNFTRSIHKREMEAAVVDFLRASISAAILDAMLDSSIDYAHKLQTDLADMTNSYNSEKGRADQLQIDYNTEKARADQCEAKCPSKPGVRDKPGGSGDGAGDGDGRADADGRAGGGGADRPPGGGGADSQPGGGGGAIAPAGSGSAASKNSK